MMEDSDILTLGWGCESLSAALGSGWPPQGDEFVTLEVGVGGETAERSQEYATLEVAKERDRQYYHSTTLVDGSLVGVQQQQQKMLVDSWDVARSSLPAPTPIHHPAVLLHPTPTAVASVTTPSLGDFYVDSFHPVQQYTYSPAPIAYPEPQTYQTYHPHVSYPSSTYSPYELKRPLAPAKFLQHRAPPHLAAKRELTSLAPKERKRPGPKARVKEEEVCKPDEPEYDPEVIANAHLTMEDDHYKCSVCKMKFKQPGNARRHIITVHRNEKPHECEKCGAKFGRKDKLKTHMMRNHGYSSDDIKNSFKVATAGRQRSSIVVNRKRSRIVVHRDNRKSTESNSNSSDDADSNPLNLKKSGRGKHLGGRGKRKVD